MKIHAELALSAPAEDTWAVVGERFGEIGDWASPITRSAMDGPPAAGRVRTCHVAGFGPVPPGVITERLLRFDPQTMTLSYEAVGGMPGFIRRAVSHWSVHQTQDGGSAVRISAPVTLRPAARPPGAGPALADAPRHPASAGRAPAPDRNRPSASGQGRRASRPEGTALTSVVPGMTARGSGEAQDLDLDRPRSQYDSRVGAGPAGISPFGRHVRRWRAIRRMSQLDLAVAAGTTARHISFVKTGRSRPGRELILRIGAALRVPLPERNALLTAAGFAPSFPAHELGSQAMEPVNRVLTAVLRRHEPYPAWVVRQPFTFLQANAGAEALFPGLTGLPPES